MAHGGSAVFLASLVGLNAHAGGLKDAEVWCVEIDLRSHNREALVAHPIYSRVGVFDGSSVDPNIATTIAQKASSCERVLVVLDSKHTHEHALDELRLYAPLVSVGSYCVVFDTVIENFFLGGAEFADRPWGKVII